MVYRCRYCRHCHIVPWHGFSNTVLYRHNTHTFWFLTWTRSFIWQWTQWTKVAQRTDQVSLLWNSVFSYVERAEKHAHKQSSASLVLLPRRGADRCKQLKYHLVCILNPTAHTQAAAFSLTHPNCWCTPGKYIEIDRCRIFNEYNSVLQCVPFPVKMVTATNLDGVIGRNAAVSN